MSQVVAALGRGSLEVATPAARVWTSHCRIRLSPGAFAAFLYRAVQPVLSERCRGFGASALVVLFMPKLHIRSNETSLYPFASFAPGNQVTVRGEDWCRSKRTFTRGSTRAAWKMALQARRRRTCSVANAAASARGSHRLPDERHMGLR